MASSKSSGFLELVKTFVFAGLIALVIRTVLFEPFNIPSGSMLPNLLIGDYLFVSKYAYGYSRHALPFSSYLPDFEGRILASQPERGDVVVFKLPRDDSTDYIKRVIGLPGDEIQVVDGILWVNGEPVDRKVDGTFANPGRPRGALPYQKYLETLPGGRSHDIIEVSDREMRSTFHNGRVIRGLPDSTEVYTVPEGHFFVMGDNRDNSKDSRFPDVGMVPFDNLVGRAEVIWFSIDGSFWNPLDWFNGIRVDRIFKSVE